MPAKRVLIFDSGVGGLSVYEHIIKLNPSIKCHYLFDNAYFPYGELPHPKLVKRLIQLLTDFMLQYPADLIVIACNTASTVALDSLRQNFNVPIVGVVPAIKPASLVTMNNVIGLLATPATVERVYTSTLIEQFAADKTVLRIGSTKLVKLAEDKLIGKQLNQSDFETILAPWLINNEGDYSEDEKESCPDTLILGCTHFPLLKDEITRCFTKPIQLVDSGEAIAIRVQKLLISQVLANKEFNVTSIEKTELKTTEGHYAFYTKAFTKQPHLLALSKSFVDYGFEALDFCEL